MPEPHTDPSGANQPDPEVQISLERGIAQIWLNRPRQLNALSASMLTIIDQALDRWTGDVQVTRLELRGRGGRGFCAGGDVKALRAMVLDDWATPEQGAANVEGYFDLEYRVDQRIAEFDTPVWAELEGITMGGGLGLGLHTTRRIGAANTTLAMPEVGIGLYPDCGVAFELARMPGRTGRWLAMTGSSIDASSAHWAGLLDEVDELECHPDDSWLASNRDWIDDCFDAEDAIEVLARLEASTNPAARECAELVRTRCPASVVVALTTQVLAAKDSTVAQVLDRDRVLAPQLVLRPDFAEGVRAQLVDRDHQARWQHHRVEDVPSDLVQTMLDRS